MLTSPAEQAPPPGPREPRSFHPRGLSASSIKPAPSEDVAPAIVREHRSPTEEAAPHRSRHEIAHPRDPCVVADHGEDGSGGDERDEQLKSSRVTHCAGTERRRGQAHEPARRR